MSVFKNYYANNKDALEYQIKIIVFIIVIYACFLAFALNAIGLWWMVGLVSVITTRWMIAFHELFHLKTADELDLISRLVPIPFAPFNLGYREYREIHMGHHKYTATIKDPDSFHILGGWLKALVGAVTGHEQATVRYILKHGLSLELAMMMFIRFIVFCAMFVLFPSAFLAWWLTLRITYIINDYVFFHLVHYRSGKGGTFAIPLPSLFKYPAIFIYGFDVVYGTMHHDIHHTHPRIAAKNLPIVAKI